MSAKAPTIQRISLWWVSERNVWVTYFHKHEAIICSLINNNESQICAKHYTKHDILCENKYRHSPTPQECIVTALDLVEGGRGHVSVQVRVVLSCERRLCKKIKGIIFKEPVAEGMESSWSRRSKWKQSWPRKSHLWLLFLIPRALGDLSKSRKLGWARMTLSAFGKSLPATGTRPERRKLHWSERWWQLGVGNKR